MVFYLILDKLAETESKTNYEFIDRIQTWPLKQRFVFGTESGTISKLLSTISIG